MGETEIQLQGLSSAEAKRRLIQYGPNQIVEGKKLSAALAFLLRFKNPLVLILVFAAILSALTGEPVSAGIIIAIIIISVVLDFVNTYRSQQAAESLKEKVQVLAHIIRDGKVQELPLHTIVPGDIVQLSAGDIIPADGKLLQAKDFFLNESALTGESFPSEKDVSAEVSMGTSVVTGNGTLEVITTGKNTKFSHIAESLSRPQQLTEFDRGIKDFSYLIMKITFVLVIFIFLVNALLKGQDKILEVFLFSAALAVGLTPELLPMIIALNLSRGSLAMSKHGVIVKRLSSIQNFGSMDVLCTDKTGTLTEDKIELVKYVDAEGKPAEEIFQYAFISSTFRSGFKNPLDKAVKEFKNLNIGDCRKIDEIPFDFERKRDSVIVEQNGKRMLISKGAPEELFKVIKFYQDESHLVTKELLWQLEAEYHALSADGFRVLAVTVKPIEDKNIYDKTDESEVTILGFIAFLDPPKKSVSDTLKRLENYGIEIKIITGDNELVTQKIAQDIHLPVKGILLGKDIALLKSSEFSKKFEQTTIFARVTPDQKRMIIEQLQKNGHVVGYLGDGINDAPSLKAADVGISVNNAVDVAKESADLILLQKDLHQLINGVIEGRKTFANTLKYLMMSLSSNFGNMFSMAGASLFFRFLPMLPTQILFNNLLYDGSQFAIPGDTVEEEFLQKPRKLNIHFIKRFMLVFGPVSSLFDFATFFVLYFGFHFTDSRFQTGWFLESLATQSLVIFLIRTRALSLAKDKPAKLLVITTMLALVIGSVAALSRIGVLFKFTPLPLPALASLSGIVLAYLLVVEFAKRIFYKKFIE